MVLILNDPIMITIFCKEHINLLKQLIHTSPLNKTSGNLQIKYFLRCAKRGTFKAVHVRNIHPINPLLTGALSVEKENQK